MAGPNGEFYIQDLEEGKAREGGNGKGSGPTAPGLVVRQSLTGRLRRPMVVTGPPETWVTFCGWRWAATGFAGAFMDADPGTWCPRCYRECRQTRNGEEAEQEPKSRRARKGPRATWQRKETTK